MKEITIEQVDLEKAQADYQKTNVATSCLIFQAVKRMGYPVRSVGTQAVFLTDGRELGLAHAQQIVFSHSSDWPEHVGKTFQISEP